MNALRCQQCLQFVFCGFWNFSGEVFWPLKPAYSRRRFSYIYIYLVLFVTFLKPAYSRRRFSYIYIYLVLFVTFLTGAFAHVNKFFVTHVRCFFSEVLARWF